MDGNHHHDHPQHGEHEVIPQPTGSIAPKKDLTIETCGVTVFLPELNKVVAIEGRQSRPAVGERSLIAEHVPFLAVPQGTYSSDAQPELSFDYEMDEGQPTRMDGFVLNFDRITVENVSDGRPPGKITGKPLGKINALAGGLELCPAVGDGRSRQVAGTLDASNAVRLHGKSHGTPEGKLVFGKNEPIDCADILVVTFEATGKGAPVIRMYGEKPPENHGDGSHRGRSSRVQTNGNQERTRSIEFKEESPWRAILGNVPWQELAGYHQHNEQDNVPLTHLELVYDIYHVGRTEQRPVPIALAPPAPAGLAGAATRTTTGRCGPTLDGGKR